MTVSRRDVLIAGAGLAGTAGLGLTPGAALAQNFPSQDFTFVCAFPPGSGADVLVRYFAEEFRKRANRTVIVENRVGAAGNIAAVYTAKAKPDGYTIHVHAGSSTAANFHLFKNPPINPAKDLRVVATLNQQPFMVVVHRNSPYKTLKELTEAMLKKGDKASYAQSNTTGMVMGELYKVSTGVKAVDVPYRTAADSVNDFESGAVDYGMMDPQSSMANMRAGRWRLLAISSSKRLSFMPDLPTMTDEGVKGVELFGWFAAMVPSATPEPVAKQLNAWFNEVDGTPQTREFLNAQGGDPWVSELGVGQEQMIKDMDAWQGYMKTARIEPQ